MIQELLRERRLPQLRSKQEMLEQLERGEYGTMPPPPETLHFETEEYLPGSCGGTVRCRRITARGTVGGNGFSFPFYELLPEGAGPHPFFLHLNYTDELPNRFLPAEELLDRGWGVLTLRYTDVAGDDGDFVSGVAGAVYPNGTRGPMDGGKLALWGWAASRIMDYAETRQNELDLKHSVLCGHSRLGKAALFAAAEDERFAGVYGAASGCSGASLLRGIRGEDLPAICRSFPFWFCEDARRYTRQPELPPFDHHWLLACIAPRPVLIGNAASDQWVDAASEYLSCVAAGDAFPGGFVCEDRLPNVDDCFFDGGIGYHLRRGTHYLSRLDWMRGLAFFQRKWNLRAGD